MLESQKTSGNVEDATGMSGQFAEQVFPVLLLPGFQHVETSAIHIYLRPHGAGANTA
jgi:hypothetical protein